MSAIEVDLRLRSPHWSRVTTSADTVTDGNGLTITATVNVTVTGRADTEFR